MVLAGVPGVHVDLCSLLLIKVATGFATGALLPYAGSAKIAAAGTGCAQGARGQQHAHAPYAHDVQVDISQVVLAQMQQKHHDLPNMEYVCADCRDMPCFRDCSFSSAIDKGAESCDCACVWLHFWQRCWEQAE
eukprot:530032-Pelagomonas_calceolata.AAC.6